MVNVEVVSSSSLRDFPKRSFCDGELVGDGSGGTNAICRRPELPNDTISGADVATFWYYACVNLFIAFFSSFRED